MLSCTKRVEAQQSQEAMLENVEETRVLHDRKSESETGMTIQHKQNNANQKMQILWEYPFAKTMPSVQKDMQQIQKGKPL